MRESKKGFIIGGVVAGFTAVATVFGFVTDLSDWKKDDTTEVAQITEATTTVTELTTEQTTETIVTTNEEIKSTETEPPVTTTEQTTTTTEEVTTEETTTLKNPENFYLRNIDSVESSELHNSDSETDTIGNIYTGNVQYMTYNGYAIYYIGGKYSKLSGLIAANTNNFQGNGDYSIITILADDIEVYSTGEFSRVSTPMEFEIDITGVQWLKIQKTSSSTYETSTILYNWKFSE